MFRYKLQTGPQRFVTVALDVTGPDDFAPLQYEGEPADVDAVRFEVETGWGIGGHTVGSETTPADLDHAMKMPHMAPFRPELIDGAAILSKYERRAPAPGSAD